MTRTKPLHDYQFEELALYAIELEGELLEVKRDRRRISKVVQLMAALARDLENS